MPPARLAVPAAALLLLFLSSTASAANFTCTAPAGTTCQSAIGYRVRNATTYGGLVSRFNTTTLAALLGANDLPPTTPSTAPVAANVTVRIPFRCLCAGNGVGQSDHLPVYTVQPQDGLDAIARNVYDAFVTYQEIATANKIQQNRHRPEALDPAPLQLRPGGQLRRDALRPYRRRRGEHLWDCRHVRGVRVHAAENQQHHRPQETSSGPDS